MQTLRIFVSSPGDVGREREIARRVIDRLQAAFARRISLEPFFWEHEPMRATADFQSNIEPPGNFDVFICILWSRLGSRLGAQHRRQDGTPYASGTEYEFENALEAYRRSQETPKLPEMLVYRRAGNPTLPIEPDEVVEEMRAQWKALNGFIKRWFFAGDGTFSGAFNNYEDLRQFETKLEEHLRKVVSERLARGAPDQAEPTPAAAHAVWTEGSPYRGLRTFEFEHAAVFFGRTSAIDAVLGVLGRRAMAERCPFLLIFGGSGSGKSSLLRAGVLPLLTRPGVVDGVGLWRWLVLKPSAFAGDLFDGLAAALLVPSALSEIKADGTTETQLAAMLRENPASVGVLVKEALSRAAREEQLRDKLESQPRARLAVGLDQLEEVFTLADRFDAEMRQGWFRAIAALARSGFVWVIATMRSDFYPRCEGSAELLALKAGEGSYHLQAPTWEEFGQIIRLPALAAGVDFEEDQQQGRLDEVIRKSVEENRAALPLVEYALDELFHRQKNGLLTFTAYQALGGVEGALAQRAAQVFSALDPALQAAFDDLFRRLVTVDTGADAVPVRLWAQVDESNASAPVRKLRDRLIEERLMISDRAQDGRTVVSIVHEALLRAWPRLAEWIAKNQEFLRARGRLARAARQWEEQKRTTDYLLPAGKPLAEAKELMEKFPEALDAAEAELVRVSRKKAEAAAARRLRIASGIAALLLALLVAAVFSWRQSVAHAREAERARAGADALVNHMLTELHEQLKSSGNVRLLASSLDKVRSHYAEYGAAIPPARRVQLRTAEGAILKSLGRGPEAAAAWREAAALAEEVLRKAPQDTELTALKAAALNRLSDLLATTDPRAGLDPAAQSISLFEKLPAEDPQRRASLAEALMNLADLERRLGDAPAALKSYQQGRALLPPAELRGNREAMVLANLLLRLGDLQLLQHLPAEAAKTFAELEGFLRDRTKAEPKNMPLQELLATTLDHLAEAAVRENNLEQAEALSKEAVGIGRALILHDPSNNEWRDRLATAVRRQAEALAAGAELPAEAIQLAGEAVDLSQAVGKLDPGNLELRRNTATALEVHARLLQRAAEETPARERARELVAWRETLGGPHGDLADLIKLAEARILYVSLLGSAPGDQGAGLAKARETIELVERSANANSLDVARLYLDLASAALAVEKAAEAQVLCKKALEVATSAAAPEQEKERLLQIIDKTLKDAAAQ